ncbi:MAG: Wzz/FepE/Etk N-terminal domain-containing protein [Candidatus Muiribacteriota bacterium]
MEDNRKNIYIEEDEIDLRELVLTILKNKKILISCVLIFGMLGVIYSFLRVPKFEVNYYVKNGISGYNDANIPQPGINITELTEWINGRLYLNNPVINDYNKKYRVSTANPKGTDLLKFSAFATDTDEAVLFIKDVINIINKSPLFLERIELGKKILDVKIQNVMSNIELQEISLQDIENRLKTFDNELEALEKVKEVNLKSVKEKTEALNYYISLLSTNETLKKEIDNLKLKNVQTDNSMTYLMYSNMVQQNLNQNVELKRKISEFQEEIRVTNTDIINSDKRKSEIQIEKHRTVTNRLKEISIKIDNLKEEKEKLSIQRHGIRLMSTLENNLTVINNKKVLIYPLGAIIAGFFAGLVLIFLVEFNKSLKGENEK